MNTTSRGGTFATQDFGTSINQFDERKRRQDVARVVDKSPQEQLIDRNIARYHAEKAAERQREADRLREQEERQRKQKEIIAHNERVRRFRANEVLIQGVMDDHGLTQEERACVYQRLLNAGAIHDWNRASVFAMEAVLTRKK